MPKRTQLRPRLRLRPHGFLGAAIVLNLLAGALWSPLTSLSKVRVIGAEKFDEARLRRMLEDRQGVPAFMVSPRGVEGQALESLEIEDANFSRNIFGRGELRLASRIPVAQVERFGENLPTSLALSENGFLYFSRQNLAGLPSVSLLPGQDAASLGIATAVPFVQLSTLCQKTPKEIDLSKCSALYKPGRGLCLNIKESQKLIVLGTTDNLDAKLKALVNLLALGPQSLEQSDEINLMAPEHPSPSPSTSLKP